MDETTYSDLPSGRWEQQTDGTWDLPNSSRAPSSGGGGSAAKDREQDQRIGVLEEEIAALQGGLTFCGTWDPNTLLITSVSAYGAARGYGVGQELPDHSLAETDYFLADANGPIPPFLTPIPSEGATAVRPGDWVLAGSTGWLLLRYSARIIDHGETTGLDDDDHPQYLTASRGDVRYDTLGAASSAVAGHEAKQNPHPQYAGTGASGKWTWSATHAGDPGNGKVSTDGTTWATTTALHISRMTALGNDANPFLTAVGVGDMFTLWHAQDASAWAHLRVTGIVGHGSWFEYEVTVDSHGTDPAKNQDIIIAVEYSTVDPDMFVKRAGDTMTGNLSIPNATLPAHALPLGQADGLFLTPTEGDSRYDAKGTAATIMESHMAEPDPHPVYTTEEEALDLAAAEVQIHVNQADPHHQYLTELDGYELFLTEDAAVGMFDPKGAAQDVSDELTPRIVTLEETDIRHEQYFQDIEDAIGQMQGDTIYVGSFDATANTVASLSTMGTARGFYTIGQPLPPITDIVQHGDYFIVAVAGPVPPGLTVVPTPPEGQTPSCYVGDWIIASANGWLLLRYSARQVDHGATTGLGDDDHPQYLNVARGDARYYTQAESNGRFVDQAGDTMTGFLSINPATGVYPELLLQSYNPPGYKPGIFSFQRYGDGHTPTPDNEVIGDVRWVTLTSEGNYTVTGQIQVEGGVNSPLGAPGSMVFFTHDGQSLTESFRVNTHGVGIGQVPAKALDVKGTIRVSGTSYWGEPAGIILGRRDYGQEDFWHHYVHPDGRLAWQSQTGGDKMRLHTDGVLWVGDAVQFDNTNGNPYTLIHVDGYDSTLYLNTQTFAGATKGTAIALQVSQAEGVGHEAMVWVNSTGVGIGRSSLGADNWYGYAPRLVVERNWDAETVVGIGNATVGANAAMSFKMIGGTGNSHASWSLRDNNGNPYVQNFYGAAVPFANWEFSGGERMRLWNTGHLTLTSTQDGYPVFELTAWGDRANPPVMVMNKYRNSAPVQPWDLLGLIKWHAHDAEMTARLSFQIGVSAGSTTGETGFVSSEVYFDGYKPDGLWETKMVILKNGNLDARGQDVHVGTYGRGRGRLSAYDGGLVIQAERSDGNRGTLFLGGWYEQGLTYIDGNQNFVHNAFMQIKGNGGWLLNVLLPDGARAMTIAEDGNSYWGYRNMNDINAAYIANTDTNNDAGALNVAYGMANRHGHNYDFNSLNRPGAYRFDDQNPNKPTGSPTMSWGQVLVVRGGPQSDTLWQLAAREDGGIAWRGANGVVGYGTANGNWSPWKRLATVHVGSDALVFPQVGDLWIDPADTGTSGYPTYTTATLEYGWNQYYAGYAVAGYSIDPFGTVRIRGLVRDGQSGEGTAIFRLPAGYWPPERLIFITAAGGGAARVDVQSDGVVKVQEWIGGGGNGWLSLSNIAFSASPAGRSADDPSPEQQPIGEEPPPYVPPDFPPEPEFPPYVPLPDSPPGFKPTEFPDKPQEPYIPVDPPRVPDTPPETLPVQPEPEPVPL